MTDQQSHTSTLVVAATGALILGVVGIGAWMVTDLGTTEEAPPAADPAPSPSSVPDLSRATGPGHPSTRELPDAEPSGPTPEGRPPIRENVPFDRGDQQPPANDGDVWAERRARANEQWRAHTYEIAARWMTAGEVTKAEGRAIKTILDTMHQQQQLARTGIESGVEDPKKGRARINDARAEATKELEHLLGSERQQKLSAEFDARQPPSP